MYPCRTSCRRFVRFHLRSNLHYIPYKFQLRLPSTYLLHKPYKLQNPSEPQFRPYIVRKLHPMSLRLRQMPFPSDNSCSLPHPYRTKFLDRKSYKRWTLFDLCYHYTYRHYIVYNSFDRLHFDMYPSDKLYNCFDRCCFGMSLQDNRWLHRCYTSYLPDMYRTMYVRN